MIPINKITSTRIAEFYLLYCCTEQNDLLLSPVAGLINLVAYCEELGP